VALHRKCRNIESAGYVFVTKTLSYQRDDLTLARCEPAAVPPLLQARGRLGLVDRPQVDASVVQVVRWQDAGALADWTSFERWQRRQRACWAAVAPPWIGRHALARSGGWARAERPGSLGQASPSKRGRPAAQLWPQPS
jgi:hypothetical protein